MMRVRVRALFIFIPCIVLSGESRLDRIALFGNRITRPEVILREMETNAGESFSDSLLQSDRAWLIRSDFLKRIDFQLKSHQDLDLFSLLIVVQEKGHWSFLPSFHTNDLFGVYGGGTLKYRNLFGRKQLIALKMEAGGKRRLMLTWSDPWFAGSAHLFTGVNLYIHEIPYPYRDYKPEFTEKSTGCELRLGKQFGRKFQAGIQTGLQHTRAGLLTGSSVDRWNSAGCFINHDTRDWPWYPRHGVLFNAEFDRWTSNKTTYQNGLFNIRVYLPMASSDILAVQFLFEANQGTVPVYKRLHLGGGDSVRGIATGLLSGDRMAMANVEYRFPIMYERNFEDNLHLGYAGVLFADAGSAWTSGNAWKRSDFRCAAGLGVHAIWRDYVIRGEYGTAGKGWGFLNIGTSVHF
jgi:outer membrane protein insertion porin family